MPLSLSHHGYLLFILPFLALVAFHPHPALAIACGAITDCIAYRISINSYE